MAKFTSVKYNNTIDNIVEGYKDKIVNPYYNFIDKNPTIVKYYNQNTSKSTLDAGLKISYSHIGSNSGIAYNRIDDFYLYGIERFSIELSNEEYGLESGGVEGEAYLLPNTIIPIPNDYFIINHASVDLLFKVIDVSVNTIENGSNMYKLNYSLTSSTDISIIEEQVSDTFNFILTNNGTQYKSILKSSEYNYILESEKILEKLKNYYISLFFNRRVQTFTVTHNNHTFYDPYLIEFIKRYDLLKGAEEYIYLDHKTTLNSSFNIEYDKSFFRMFETCNTNKDYIIDSYAIGVEEYLSILATRAEMYYKIYYTKTAPSIYLTVLENLNSDLYGKIKNNNKYTTPNYKNMIISYLNKGEFVKNDMESIHDIDYDSDIELFYNIPLLIYIIECKIKSKMITHK